MARKIFVGFLFLLFSSAAASAAEGAPDISAAAGETGRSVFRRMEENAGFTVTVRNPSALPIYDLKATVEMGGVVIAEGLAAPGISPGGREDIVLPVDTTLKPGRYILSAAFSGNAGGRPLEFAAEGEVTIVPRPLTDTMPVLCWGGPDIEFAKKIGFTHSFTRLPPMSRGGVWEAGGPVVPFKSSEYAAEMVAEFDRRLAARLNVAGYLFPGRMPGIPLAERQKYQRVDRGGMPYPRENVCGLSPEIQDFCYDVGLSIAKTFGNHPALACALIHSEVRDGTEFCFCELCTEAYRSYSGRDIPEEAASKLGVPAALRSELVPANGIIEDDDPVLDYYRWFWKEGDGWNELHSRVHRGLKEETPPDFWTFFDPAVRCPPVWGSGGEADVISHWTYTDPTPLAVGHATDEVFAMAEGRPGQRVMKMTQTYWKRYVAPLPEKEEDRTEWEKENPEGSITMSPDHISIALWVKLARPVEGIMYHSETHLGGGGFEYYRFTNPETPERLAGLTRDVVKPLGPSLLQIPDPEADVAILDSFASSVFTGRLGWGWEGAVRNKHVILQMARLQPRVLYEETILRDGLDGISVLVMPNYPVLPRGVYEAITEFQWDGGIVVGDENLARAITPDIVIRSFERSGVPDEDKAAMHGLASRLREELQAIYSWRADSSCPDTVVRLRSYGETDYLFAVNDRRTYGDYVGQHGNVMEKGLPLSSTLWVNREDVHVYDVLAGKAVPVEPGAPGTRWESSFGPGEGRLFMITPRPVSSVRVETARRRNSDRKAEVKVSVLDDNGRPLDAVVPVKVEIIDPAGAEAEFTGYYGAKDGTAAIRLDLAENDAEGSWEVRAKELVSGLTASARFTYRR